jgi:hypothetical protein
MKIVKTLAILVPALALSHFVSAQTTQPVDAKQIPPTEVQKTNAERTMTEGAVVVEPTMPITLIEFKSVDYDFGKIKQGDRVRTKFTFTNKGPNPAKLENVKAGCGCTIPTWPQEEIAVGESRDIEVEFNSAGKSGLITKTVSVTYNGEPRVIMLTFKANIEVPPAPAADPNGAPAPAPSPSPAPTGH